ILATPAGATHVVRPEFDPAIEGEIRRFFDDHMSVRLDHFRLSESELADAGLRLVAEACRPRSRA
ncbi:MAG TPA: formylmethanofuran dehydrogenase subunit A, partial [Stellaceae bacterium]|nr:formylmethanofuran dehydrogenase subunit A [Stellaceae bacterium]